MPEFKEYIEQYNLYIIIGTGSLLLISIILQMVLWKKLNKLKESYKRLTRGVNVSNLEELILNFTDRVENINQNVNNLNIEQKQLSQEITNCIITPKIVRYNAFEDMGSNLSFTTALLDKEKNGLVLTSIYCRDESRFYAKVVQAGESQQNLSPEEKAILEEYEK
ncbi:MAG: DUF4446 family protein [Firmicutes bacterium]|nr:DUF4446 family protein [Bacillota bacterium]